MKLIVKHYYCFGKKAENVGRNLLISSSWDTIRLDEDESTPFSIPSNRNKWIEKCKNHTIMVERGKAIANFLKIKRKNFKKVISFGFGAGFMEYNLKANYPEIQISCSDFAPKAVERLKNVFIHVCTDGRDTDPYSGKAFVAKLQEHLNCSTGKIASLIGRYYTMDRDKRWERVKQGYDLMVSGKGKPVIDVLEAIQESYDSGITDEFIKPIVVVDECANPIGTVREGDVFICFNFRTDRLREITTVLSQKFMEDTFMPTIPLYYVTLTRYDETYKDVRVMYDKEDIVNTLGEVLAKNGLSQLRIAETEKYPHVTFFFSGGREDAFIGEKRVMISSPKVATYDLKPSMSAVEVKDAVINEIQKNKPDFICLNFANADMVGHTGFYEAIKEAVETVDKCVKEVSEAAMANDYSIMITADHGNADFVINADGTPNTAHTCNPVPCFLIDNDYKTIMNGKLSDIAPTLLTIMGIDVPKEMTGKVLIKK